MFCIQQTSKYMIDPGCIDIGKGEGLLRILSRLENIVHFVNRTAISYGIAVRFDYPFGAGWC